MRWTKATVDEALKTYVADKARAGHLALEIADLERRVAVAKAQLAGDEAGPRAQVISDMPHGTTVGNPTEELAVKLASGWLPPEIKEMQNELEAEKAEHGRLSGRVQYVETWLSALTEREGWVVLHQYSGGETWHNVMADYQRQYGEYLSKETLKRMRASGFRKVYRTAEIRG